MRDIKLRSTLGIFRLTAGSAVLALFHFALVGVYAFSSIHCSYC